MHRLLIQLLIDKIDEERRKGKRTTRFAAIISTTTTAKVNRILNQAHSALSLFKDICVIAL
jgi:hypothetical protein